MGKPFRVDQSNSEQSAVKPQLECDQEYGTQQIGEVGLESPKPLSDSEATLSYNG